jgi:hypothetical protein
MIGHWQRVAEDLANRLSAGPLRLRLFMQPAMATFFGIRDGLKDAREGRSRYLRTILTGSQYRKPLIVDGLKAVSKLLIVGTIMEVIYQAIVLRTFYLGEAIIVVLSLAFLPYLLIRGPANLIARWWWSRHSTKTI